MDVEDYKNDPNALLSKEFFEKFDVKYDIDPEGRVYLCYGVKKRSPNGIGVWGSKFLEKKKISNWSVSSTE